MICWMCGSDSAWNTMMSSIRLMNSAGTPAHLIHHAVLHLLVGGVLTFLHEAGVMRLPIRLVPRFEVMMRIVFLKPRRGRASP